MMTKSKVCPVCGKVVKLNNGMYSDHTTYNADFKFETLCITSGKYISDARELAQAHPARADINRDVVVILDAMREAANARTIAQLEREIAVEAQATVGGKE